MTSKGINRQAIPDKIIPRFWSKVGVSGINECWEWRARKRPDGYGDMWDGSRVVLAHVVAYSLGRNESVPAGMCVCHQCDNPPCCNPAHLFMGTQGENNTDRHRKGRTANHVGVFNGRAILTEDDVLEIRKIGHSQTYVELGRRFGVKPETISHAVRRIRWRHLP